MLTTCARTIRRALAAAGMAAGALLAPTPAWAHDAKAHADAWPAAGDYQRSVRSYAIPDVVLTDADARPVRLRELLATNDPLMLNFIFTTCGTVCPVMVKVFADVPASLGARAANLRLISISMNVNSCSSALTTSCSTPVSLK